jgi:hypothetical protein
MPHAIDFDPGPVVSVDGGCVGFVGLEFHEMEKVMGGAIKGQALKTAPKRPRKCGQIIGFPASTLPLEAL